MGVRKQGRFSAPEHACGISVSIIIQTFMHPRIGLYLESTL